MLFTADIGGVVLFRGAGYLLLGYDIYCWVMIFTAGL
jgi:hypothetical protein